MPTYQIKMLWKCRACNCSVNRGLDKHCINCGKPKDEKNEEIFPEDLSEANALTGEEKQKALAGPDWFCKYCSSLQNNLSNCCSECGVDKLTGAKNWQVKTKNITENLETREKILNEITHSDNDIIEVRIDDYKIREPQIIRGTISKDSRKSFLNESIDDNQWEKFSLKPSRNKKLFIGSIIIMMLCTLLYFVFRTKIVDAQVSALYWEHRVLIERYQIKSHDGWYPDSNAISIENLGPKVHHYDHIKVGTHNEPSNQPYGCNCKTIKGTCFTTLRTCVSNKNGTATCSGGDKKCNPDTQQCNTCYRLIDHWVDDYIDQPKFQNWYSWRVWEWNYNRTIKNSGTNQELSWPTNDELIVSLQDGEKERISEKQMTYKVTFISDSNNYTIEPKTSEEFLKYSIGKHFRLKVGFANGVEVYPR